MPINVALIHLKLKPIAKRSNMEKARKLVKEAAQKGADIVVLPSLFNIGPYYLHYPPTRSRTITRNQAERIPGITTETLASIAVENGVYIVAGPIVERAGPKLFLTTVIIAPNGSLIQKYRKIAVSGFDADLGISPGRSIVTFKVRRVFGVMAEDDIYYPEIARSLLIDGATCIIVPLRHGDEEDRVKLALRARSMENKVPILAVGGMFETNEKLVEVPTMVVDPQSGIVEEMKGQENFILVQVADKSDPDPEVQRSASAVKSVASIYCKLLRDKQASAPPARQG